MISRVTMRKAGLAKYLEDGKRADSKLERNDKDNVVPLYGSLSNLKKAEDYCNKHKTWSSNYEHITISFSDEDIAILEAMTEEDYRKSLSDIVSTMIKHRTSGYDIDNEVIAYAELHDPKLKSEVNARTGEVQKRRKHIHIGISYLNPLSDTKLRTTFYNNSYISDTIDKYIAKKHGLTYVEAKAPSDNDIDKPSQMTINRNILKEAVKDFTTKEELYSYLDANGVKYDFTNKSTKSNKQQNIYVYNDKGGKIHLRGKDFPNIEIMHNPTLDETTKHSYIKELKSKSLQELGDILETYYKTNRIPIIAKRRSKESTKLLNDIYEQSNNDIMNDKVNSFTSLQAKIFYKHYKHLVTTNLKGYYVDTKNDDAVKFTNKSKDIQVTDYGERITANSSTKNLEEKVKLMIDIAIAKGWELSSINISGSEAFKAEAYKQIADVIREKREAQNKTLPLQTVATVKGIQRPKNITQYLAKECKEKREADAIPLAELKEKLDAKSVLAYAVEKYKLDISLYEVTADNKINNKSNRQKPKNVIDFLQKEVSLTTSEAIEQCQELYANQPMTVVSERIQKAQTPIEKRGDLQMPLHISINKSGQRNALSGWEVVEMKDYSRLATLMKQYPYSVSRFDTKRDANNVKAFNNLLIFDVDNDPNDKQLSMAEAKVLLESKGVSAMILPSKSNQIEKFTSSGESKGIVDRYRIIIPIKSAIRNDTDKDTYAEFMELTAKALGLEGSIDTSALKDKARYYYQSPLSAVPLVVKAEKVMDVTNLESRAIRNVQEARAEKEAQRIKMEELRANLKKYRAVSMPTSNNLTYVDAEELMDVPITMLIHKFESGEEKEEGSYRYIKTDATKYSIIDDKLAHDFKNDVTYNSLTYLQMQYETKNLNIIARELQKTIGGTYIRVNTEAVKTAVGDALRVATNDKTFEESIKEYFGCEYVKLGKDTIKIADQSIALSEIGTNKGLVVDALRGNREAIKAEQEAKAIEETVEVKAVRKEETEEVENIDNFGGMNL